MDSVTKYFPNAISVKDLEQKVVSDLFSLGFSPAKTIWGTSICSDELNNSINFLSGKFAAPGAFRFGGISGYPFTGKTGVLAFASHIPDNGGAFILYGPHIGISSNGAVGELLREQQKVNSTCCGSIIAALNSVKSQNIPKVNSPSDLQQDTVINMLNDNKTEILSAENEILQATEVVYKNTKSEMLRVVKSLPEAFKNNNVYLMGGILINTDWNKLDYFDVRDTEFLEF